MKTTVFPRREIRIIGREPERELLERWLSMPREKRKREYVCTARAAAIAGVSRRTILDWIQAGRIASVRTGKKHQICLRSLEAYLHGGSGS